MSRFRSPRMPALYVGPHTTQAERDVIWGEYDRLRAECDRASQERRKLAEPVIESLAEYEPEALEIVGHALEMGGGQLAGVGRVFCHVAAGKTSYATTALAGQLLELAADDELVERLGYTTDPPWPALSAALETIRAEDASGIENGELVAPTVGDASSPGRTLARDRTADGLFA